MSKYIDDFKKILTDNQDKNNALPYIERDICPPSTSAQLALDCLCDIFLGEDFYIAFPVCQEQANTVILYDILRKYDKSFKKWTNKKD